MSRKSRRLLALLLCCAGCPVLTQGQTQLAAGAPEVRGQLVGVPFYLSTGDGVTAGQFDIPIPAGWLFERVETDPRFVVTHEMESDVVSGGSLRVVFYSPVNATTTGGTLGTVYLLPPVDAGALGDLSFLNPVFAKPDGAGVALVPGFPALRIVAQPAAVTVYTGQRAQISVSVIGVDPQYQWYAGERGETGTPVGQGGVFRTVPLTANGRFWVRVSDVFGASVDSAAVTVTVTDQAAVVLSPNSVVLPAVGGSSSFTVETLEGAPWSGSTDAGWISLDTGSGNGTGTLSFSYADNPGLSSRSAVIEVGGAQFSVTQSKAGSVFAGIGTLPGNPYGWKWVPGFGWLADGLYPYVYHLNHGWLYYHPMATGAGQVIYSLQGDLGWVRNDKLPDPASYNWLYTYRYEGFVYFAPDASPQSRLFYDPSGRGWFEYPEQP